MIEIKTKLEYLPILLDKTRKSRIEAERRLLKLDALAKHACVYYACVTTLLSLSTLFFDYKGLPFCQFLLLLWLLFAQFMLLHKIMV